MSEALLLLRGPVTGKKNQYRRKRGGGMYIPENVKTLIDTLILQARSQWNQPPLDRAFIHVKFYLTDYKGDLDNKYTELQDALVKAGCLINDTPKHVTGFHVEHELADEERTEVRLLW